MLRHIISSTRLLTNLSSKRSTSKPIATSFNSTKRGYFEYHKLSCSSQCFSSLQQHHEHLKPLFQVLTPGEHDGIIRECAHSSFHTRSLSTGSLGIRTNTSTSSERTQDGSNNASRSMHSTSLTSAAVELPSSPSESIPSLSPPPFQKILIANRGEIARRIIKTCHKLNIQTVAIYSTTDSKSPHVNEATESICIGPTASSESYLNIPNLIKAIKLCKDKLDGSLGVHPGYGFLSENAEFCQKIEDIGGVTFIGPHSDAIIAMGDKITSKQIAQNANVNVIPGYDGFVTSQSHAVEIANSIGYPVMIKATSGGGGKGMRICYNDDQVKEGFLLSTAEAKSFFNDDRLFIEKFIERPHHIEIQLLAGRRKKQFCDDNGKEEKGEEEGELEILCFPERECSIQRRNQKILEESPSTLLKPETRAEMIRQVKSLVRKVGYTSAGTVEFLVDEEQNFYFLEMNTRLQVEHPVTEMVSGDVDLVYGMISIAAGRGIPQEYLDLVTNGYDISNMTEEEIEGLCVPYKGHAIEARIYAEDPIRGFLPATGPLVKYVEPLSSIPSCITDDELNDCKIRVDSGVLPGSIISQYYDPMISKLIAYSPHSRSGAIDALKGAIDRYVIKGIAQNTSFLSSVLRNEYFINGSTPTNFIDLHYPDGFAGVELNNIERAELAAVVTAVAMWKREYLNKPNPKFNNGDSVHGEGLEEFVICMGGMFGIASKVQVSNRSIIVSHMNEVSNDKTYDISIDSIEYDPSNPIVNAEINGSSKAFQIQNEDNIGSFNVQYCGASFDCLVMSVNEYELSLIMKEPKQIDTSNLVLSPMPGTLISYAVKEGDHVVVGQEICIVEAMKMQNVLRSTRSGVIKKCYAEVGSSLMTDETIVEFENEYTVE